MWIEICQQQPNALKNSGARHSKCALQICRRNSSLARSVFTTVSVNCRVIWVVKRKRLTYVIVFQADDE
ncbi:hypothetical protein L596_021948 [Steinernema carpocapsae]|uniref:Uncharacterized protein n=1 Tax=Steinernema carpocapsae TaxID=34508 RepID=A0A4U5MKA5_STECR|nr:hypothetical protein L596_021948 [Steinernema carpocapsae]